MKIWVRWILSLEADTYQVETAERIGWKIVHFMIKAWNLVHSKNMT